MFYNLRKTIHNYFLRRKLKKSNTQHGTCNFENAKKIGVLFVASSGSKIEITSKFIKELQRSGKTVDILGYVATDKNAPSIPYDYMTRKNLNFFYVPNHPKAKSLMESKLDVLINLSLTENIPLEYISSLSNASYRIGIYNEGKTSCYDLMIQYDEEKGFENLTKQVLHYMKAIK